MLKMLRVNKSEDNEIASTRKVYYQSGSLIKKKPTHKPCNKGYTNLSQKKLHTLIFDIFSGCTNYHEMHNNNS